MATELLSQTSQEATNESSLTADSVRRTMDTIGQIRQFVLDALRPGEDFIEIPGVSRPVLGQPGAEKIALLFNCRSAHEIQARELPDGHVEYIVTTRMISRKTGESLAEGIGSCTTLESRYRYRNGQRRCPRCLQETIYKSKDDSGYFCWKVKGGCGANFAGDDPAITGQKVGKIENDNIHDMRNTVLKMAKKRADVDAAKTLGCVSGHFTQDLEESVPFGREEPARSPQPTPAAPAKPARAPSAPVATAPAPSPRPAPATKEKPAPASRPATTVAKPGVQFWKVLGSLEKEHAHPGLRDEVAAWGARQGFPKRVVDWSHENVGQAHDYVDGVLSATKASV